MGEKDVLEAGTEGIAKPRGGLEKGGDDVEKD